MKAESPREIAVRILQRRQRSREYVERLLEEALGTAALSGPDRGLCQELTYGIVRWEKTLDRLIARKTAGRTQNEQLRILLQLGLYQIFWLERIPHHAAVHETVELGKKLGLGPKSGFLNAVLRGYLREEAETRKFLEELKVTEPAVGYSCPEWLVERWKARWGVEKTVQLLAWNNNPPPTFARVNRLKVEPAALIEMWREEGVNYITRQWDWTRELLAFELESHPALNSLKSFRDGFFYVQDPSTLLAVRELDPQPGETVLDLCAAPGGKTTFAAQLMQNTGKIVAQDNQAERLKLVEENCQRLGVTCVEIKGSAELYDRILLDAPCSNTGVLRRRVDLRWLIRVEEIARLSRVQAQLLRDAAGKLKPGGTLIYSTCSLEAEENEQVVQAFLAENKHFKLDKERQLLPFIESVDGAYVAKLQKQS